MALPLAPIAAGALRYGAVALTTYAIARSVERGRRDQRVEDALDEAPEGLTARREKAEDSEQVNATARIRRVIRLGENGPGVEIDAVGLTRIRFKKV
jgi:rhamnogalacturonyl hydrolase YesR